jgi:hypothetical protein
LLRLEHRPAWAAQLQFECRDVDVEEATRAGKPVGFIALALDESLGCQLPNGGPYRIASKAGLFYEMLQPRTTIGLQERQDGRRCESAHAMPSQRGRPSREEDTNEVRTASLTINFGKYARKSAEPRQRRTRSQSPLKGVAHFFFAVLEPRHLWPSLELYPGLLAKRRY